MSGSSANPRESRSGHFRPEYGVPYTKFRIFPDGFTVSFRRTSEYVFKLTHGFGAANDRAVSAGNSQQGSMFVVLFFAIFFVVYIALGVWWIIDRLMFRTTIAVSHDWVNIGRQYIPRHEFGDFLIHHTLSRGRNTVAVLGYATRNRRCAFGGVWPVTKAEEVARALNALLRALPATADQHRASPEDLRTARPTRF
jgi:hypothetical protein